MKIQDFKALRRAHPGSRAASGTPSEEVDRSLHRYWVMVPALIFALLAAVAVFGDGPAEHAAAHALDLGAGAQAQARP